ncbi:radical SAM protein [Streptomyces sp. NBC_01462]|uniref:radical SAM protein n=2 Tax=unclassified Streptomyces TaxID=2593676 RepID=UPI002E36C063|nr:radical SAM protein [Streptomyces sp. NBC_01462]
MEYNADANTFSGNHHVGLPQVMWHITDVCALTCPYCFSTKSGLGTPFEYLEPIAERLKQIGVLKVDFGGGEPVSYERFDKAVDLCEQRNMHLTVTTSGVISPRSRHWLLENQERFARVIVSIDGTSIIHDRLRGRIGAFRDALGIMTDLLSLGAKVRVNTVFTSAITREVIKNLQRILEAELLTEWCLIQPHPSNAKQHFDSYAIEDVNFRALVAWAREESNNETKLIERPRSAYVGYWTLHPGGRMRPQGTGSEDGEGFHLLDASLEEAMRELGKVPIKVPTE